MSDDSHSPSGERAAADAATAGGDTRNEPQRSFIEQPDGIRVVDAGPGTGKTYSVVRRYAHILEETSATPEDILLLTYTRSAAEELRDRIIDHLDRDGGAIRNAAIGTFHSHCNRLLRTRGTDTPAALGLEGELTGDARILESDGVEVAEFSDFTRQFKHDHPQYEPHFQVVNDDEALLGLIKQLGAKGVIPTREGWYRDSDRFLRGDREAFFDIAEAANAPNQGANGPINSDLSNDIANAWRNAFLPPDAPARDAIRGANTVECSYLEEAFDADRETLLAFVHDLYVEYLQFALDRNFLNFSFLQVFGFVHLCETGSRDDHQFDYVMIDEFQDTSELQFKLMLLLAATDNIAVVGDWKQSIYSFQYAAVENITDFETRLERFVGDLNRDTTRITYPVDEVTRRSLVRNYRATQPLIDFTETTLTRPATKSEDIDAEAIASDITHLEANTPYTHSNIEAYQGADEQEGIVGLIQHIVGNDDYLVADAEAMDEDGGAVAEYPRRPPRYEDIAVLARKNQFCRDLVTTAEEHGVPAAYRGGIDLFSTEPAILLLAWLRVVADYRPRRGWAVILERAGYAPAALEAMVDAEAYPDALEAFRDALTTVSIGEFARRVFSRYSLDGVFADAVLAQLDALFEASLLNRTEVIRFIERAISEGTTFEISASPGEDSVSVQTLHSAKGQEFPIVIIAGINTHGFPLVQGDRHRIRYTEPIGLRQTKLVDDGHGHLTIYDNWRFTLLSAALSSDYDEERRLLYVGTTRAEDHLLLTAGEDPSPFFETLDREPMPFPTPPAQRPTDPDSHSAFDPPVTTGERTSRSLSPHDLMDESVHSEGEGGAGMAFGTQVHDFAEDYLAGDVTEPVSTDEEHIRQLLDGLDGTLSAEQEVYLPLTIDGTPVTLSGVIDLLVETLDAVQIIDYKTDRSRVGVPEYRKQLSVYYHAVSAIFPDRSVAAELYFTEEGEIYPIEPLDMTELRSLVADTIADAS